MHTIEVRDEIEPTEEVVYQAATGTSRFILDARPSGRARATWEQNNDLRRRTCGG
jgi:hypothetical protein